MLYNQPRLIISVRNATRYDRIWESHFNVFMQKKDLKVFIVKQNSAPSSFQKVKRKGKNQDSIYKNIQNKNMNFEGPLESYGMLWSLQIKMVEV